MPLYEYSCQSCGTKEEKLEGISAPTEHDCPKCGTPQGMHREVSLTSFTLAGGGWHAQGYAGTPGKKTVEPAGPAKTETPAAPASGGGCAGGCACHSAKPAN